MLTKTKTQSFASAIGLTFLLFIFGTFAVAADVPALKGRVNDYGNMLSAATKKSLEQKLAALEISDSSQIVVLTIPSLQGDSLSDYSIRVVDSWKIGQQEFDNGALLLISKGDRKIRIEVGYGLEGVLTDLLSGRIINSIITPAFKNGDFDKGIASGVDAMIGVVKGEFTANDLSKSSRNDKPDDPGGVIAILIFSFIFLSRVSSTHSALAMFFGAVIVPLIGILMGAGSVLILVGLAVIGAILGLIVGYFSPPASGGGSGGHSRSGMWIGTGRSSGGGFGGFSGSGGSFGGGGASGGW